MLFRETNDESEADYPERKRMGPGIGNKMCEDEGGRENIQREVRSFDGRKG